MGLSVEIVGISKKITRSPRWVRVRGSIGRILHVCTDLRFRLSVKIDMWMGKYVEVKRCASRETRMYEMVARIPDRFGLFVRQAIIQMFGYAAAATWAVMFS
jgi:hypothetical protein